MRASGGTRDDDGAVAILTVGAMALLFAFLAVTIDIGMLYLVRRNLQGAADAAALAASLNPASAGEIVSRTVAANGFDASVVDLVEIGTYDADPAVQPDLRFKPDETPADAARVTLKTNAPLYFLRYFDSTRRSVPIEASATATYVPEASFAAGTRLLGLDSEDSAILNTVLGGLLGGDLKLKVLDYEALAAADVNLLQMLDALATNLKLTAGSYDKVLAATVEVGDVLRATADALRESGSGASAQALAALAQLQLNLPLQPDPTGRHSLQLGELLDLGDWAPLPPGSGDSDTARHAKLPVLDLIGQVAQVANGSSMLDLSLPASIPGVATADLRLAVGEGEQRIGLSPVGTTLHTAQTRLLLDLKLVDLGLSDDPLVRLPLYVELAPGTARLDKVSCRADPTTDGEVTVKANTGLARLRVADVSADDMTNFSEGITPKPAKVVNLKIKLPFGLELKLVTVTAQADASVGGSDNTEVVFTPSEIAARTHKEVGTTGVLGTLLATLASSLKVTPELLGVPLFLVQGAIDVVLDGLKGVLNAVKLDDLVDGLLRALGVRVGAMDVAVLGMRCGVPALVQ